MKTTNIGKTIVIWLCAIALFVETLDSTIIILAIPTIAKALTIPPLQLKYALTSYLLAVTMIIPISGHWADKFGTKVVFSSGLFLFTIGSLACALSNTLPALVLSRILQGMGGAVILPVSRMMLLQLFEKHELVKASNYFVIPGLLGPIAGQILGGALIHFTSWHWIFLINIPIGILGIILTLRYVHNQKEDRAPIDYIGFLLYSVALVILAYLLDDSAQLHHLWHALMLAASSATLFVGYFYYSKGRKNPILATKLFRDRTFRFTSIGMTWTRMSFSGFSLLIPIMLQSIYHLTPLHTAYMMSALAIGMIIGKLIQTYIYRYITFKQLLIITNTTLCIDYLLITHLSPTLETGLFIALLVISGVLMSSFFTASNVLCFSSLKPLEISQGTSINATVRQFSRLAGIGLTTLVLGYAAQTNITVSNLLSREHFNHTFMFLAILTITSNLFLILLKHNAGEQAIPK